MAHPLTHTFLSPVLAWHTVQALQEHLKFSSTLAHDIINSGDQHDDVLLSQMIEMVKVPVGSVVIERRVDTVTWQDTECILLPCERKRYFKISFIDGHCQRLSIYSRDCQYIPVKMQHLAQQLQLGKPQHYVPWSIWFSQEPYRWIEWDRMEVATLAPPYLSPQFFWRYFIASDLLSWLEERSFKDLHWALPTIITLTP